ncbi:MAG TPA: PilN domain-containing protein [Thermodesulfovibrionales bacterium]|nr:PilN domain-containing protein [Thermodesulfovibrionales bacterium]
MTVALTAQKLASTVSGSAARLKTLWEPLSRFLTFSLADDSISPARNVSVCIEKGIVSVAYGSRALSRIRIKGMKTYPTEDKYPTPEGLASSVSLAMRNLNASRADVTLCIPKAWAVMKSSELPSTVRDSLPDVISYEMDRLTPFTHDEALYDFRVLREEGGKLTVMVVAAKADLIEPYIAALREKGCNVTRVTMNLSGLGTLSSFVHKCADTVLFKLGEKEYEAALFSDGSITAARTGSLAIGDEGIQLDSISGEIERLVEESKKGGKSPRVVLSLKDCPPALREMLKLRMNTAFKILEEGVGTLGLPSGEIRYEAVGGVLESLWPKAKGLNLLKKGVLDRVKKPLTFSIVLVAAILAIWFVSIFVPMANEGKRLEEIQREIAARKEEVKKVEALKKEIEALEIDISSIKNFKVAKPMTLDMFKEMTRILPKTTWLSRIRVTSSTVEIEGYATSATELLSKLETSKYFEKVEFASPTFRDVRMNAERFNIKMDIEGMKKEEVKQPAESRRQPASAPASAPAKGGAVKK